MPKGMSIKPIEPLIVETFESLYNQDPKVTAKEVRAEVLIRLKDKYRTKQLPPEWPGISAVGKLITEIKKKMVERGSDPKDKPWSISTLTDYDIPPEVLPAVMRLQASAIKYYRPFTIREALWVARLYYAVKESKLLGEDLSLLGMMASKYTRIERIKQVLADINKLPDIETKMWLEWYDDAILYYFMTYDIEPCKMTMTKLYELAPELFNEESFEEEPLVEEEFKEFLRLIQQKGGQSREKS